jgi:DNA processing protein
VPAPGSGTASQLGFWHKFDKLDRPYELGHVDPPQTLFFRGRDSQVLNADFTVGFGGTVSPTTDGAQLTTCLAQVAGSEGAVVISGGVYGVDMMAHLGALDVAAATVAVVANDAEKGLHPYFPQRKSLETLILQRGGIVSEHQDNEGDFFERLLQRDRIITALSSVFVVVECSGGSATVDTAKRAYIQGVPVVAVIWDHIPELWHAPRTAGNELLLREKFARPFPRKPVKSYGDIGDEFKQMLRSLK